MNDRYLYRAKRTDNGEWTTWNIFTGIPHDVSILEDTACDCTGLKDKNGKMIWENDIVIINGWIGKVMWSSKDTAYIVLPNDDIKNETYCLGYWVNEYNVEVIGNEIDNPELLEVGE